MKEYLDRLEGIDLPLAIKENDLIPQLVDIGIEARRIVLACADRHFYYKSDGGHFLPAITHLKPVYNGSGNLSAILRRDYPPSYDDAVASLEDILSDGVGKKVYVRVDLSVSGRSVAMQVYVYVGVWAKK